MFLFHLFHVWQLKKRLHVDYFVLRLTPDKGGKYSIVKLLVFSDSGCVFTGLMRFFKDTLPVKSFGAPH